MDILDEIEEIERPILEARIRAVSAKAAAMPKGEPGECDKCGEPSGRLVNRVCAPCRDKRKLP